MQIKNVVIVNDFNYIQGGASKVAIDTAKLLKDCGYNIYFFSAVSKEDDKIAGIKYISTNQNEALKEKNRIKGILNGLYNFKVKKEFNSLLKTLNKDETIIHIHGWTKALSSSVFDMAFKMKFKVIVTFHDYFSICPNGAHFNYKKVFSCKYKGNDYKCLICDCDSRNYPFKLYRCIRFFVQNKIVKFPQRINKAICISEMSKNQLNMYLTDIPKAKVIYNPISIDINKIDFVNIKESNYFLYVGRVDKEKGVEIFCEAINQLGLFGVVVR